MEAIEIVPFDKIKISEIEEFISQNPWKPIWTKELILEFLSRLISRNELVLDLHIKRKRIAVAVLIDKINNPGNHACLEILGVEEGFDPELIYQTTLDAAKARCPTHRNGIVLAIHDSLKFRESFFQENNLTDYYETFEMLHPYLETTHEYNATEISPLLEGDYASVYEVLTKSFVDNPDTSIPTFEDWKAAKINSNSTSTWIYRKDNQIVGFINILASNQTKTAEIRTVGVLPEWRGEGIGQKLIVFVLNYLNQLGFKKCQLTVAVKNKKALHLYEKLGFAPVDHYFNYRWSPKN